MKNKLNSSIYTALACFLGFLGNASANQYYENTTAAQCCCSPCDIHLACLPELFEAEFTALWLQPHSSSLHYVSQATPLPVDSPSWNIYDIKPDYTFAFDVGVALNICEKSGKLALKWQHFDSTTSASHEVPESSDMLGPFFEIGPDGAPYKNAIGEAKFRFDSISLKYGIVVDFGNSLRTNLFAGVNWAYIKQSLSATYSDTDDTIYRTINTPSSFNGVGPQIGMDSAYNICNGLNITGKGAASLLIGQLKNHTSYTSVFPIPNSNPDDFVSPNNQSTTVNTRTGFVPAFEAKLGVSYTFNACDCMSVSVEAGYEARVYFDAIQSVDIGSEVVTPPVVPDTTGVFARTFERNSSNFALAGPYVNLNIAF